MNTQPYNETKRQIEHLVPLGFAFLLPFLTWTQALGLAFLSILYALFISGRLVRGTYRPYELARGFSLGKFSYGLSVFLLILFFHDRMFVVGAVWANLAVGDSLSNIVGRRWGHAKLPWNPVKSWAGLIAFWLAGTLSGALLIWWIGPPPEGPYFSAALLWSYAILAAGVCALVESLPDVIDDNLSLCFAGGVVLYTATYFNASWGLDVKKGLTALTINLLLGTLGYLAGTVKRSGWLAGMLIGSLIYYCAGYQGYLILLLFFVLGSGASRLGYRHKLQVGIAQEAGGQRGARHAVANCLAGLLCAVGAAVTSVDAVLMLAFVGSFATASFDTVATEVGQWLGGRPVLLFPPRRVAAGTEGAISVQGTLAGLVASLLVTTLAFGLGLVDVRSAVAVTVGAVVGSMVESLLGAVDTRELPMKNEILNFTNTAVGATAGVLIGVYFPEFINYLR